MLTCSRKEIETRSPISVYISHLFASEPDRYLFRSIKKQLAQMELDEAEAIMLRLKASAEDKRLEAAMMKFHANSSDYYIKIDIDLLYKREEAQNC